MGSEIHCFTILKSTDFGEKKKSLEFHLLRDKSSNSSADGELMLLCCQLNVELNYQYLHRRRETSKQLLAKEFK